MNIKEITNGERLEWTIELSRSGLKFAIGFTDKHGKTQLLQKVTFERGLRLEDKLPEEYKPVKTLKRFVQEYSKAKMGHDMTALVKLKDRYMVCRSGDITRLMKKSNYNGVQMKF